MSVSAAGAQEAVKNNPLEVAGQELETAFLDFTGPKLRPHLYLPFTRPMIRPSRLAGIETLRGSAILLPKRRPLSPADSLQDPNAVEEAPDLLGPEQLHTVEEPSPNAGQAIIALNLETTPGEVILDTATVNDRGYEPPTDALSETRSLPLQNQSPEEEAAELGPSAAASRLDEALPRQRSDVDGPVSRQLEASEPGQMQTADTTVTRISADRGFQPVQDGFGADIPGLNRKTVYVEPRSPKMRPDTRDQIATADMLGFLDPIVEESGNNSIPPQSFLQAGATLGARPGANRGNQIQPESSQVAANQVQDRGFRPAPNLIAERGYQEGELEIVPVTELYNTETAGSEIEPRHPLAVPGTSHDQAEPSEFALLTPEETIDRVFEPDQELFQQTGTAAKPMPQEPVQQLGEPGPDIVILEFGNQASRTLLQQPETGTGPETADSSPVQVEGPATKVIFLDFGSPLRRPLLEHSGTDPGTADEAVPRQEGALAREVAFLDFGKPERRPESFEIASLTKVPVAIFSFPKQRPESLKRANSGTSALQREVALLDYTVPKDRPKGLKITTSAPKVQKTVRQENSSIVTEQATEANVLNLRYVNLIGVAGSAGKRRALIRLPSGKIIKLREGSRFDGGRIVSIGIDSLTYVKQGKNHVLQVP